MIIKLFRQAENAWGARAMGQLLMKMYPELSCVQADVLGTGKFFSYLEFNFNLCFQKPIPELCYQ